jgi:hypothetical protein
MRGCILKYEQKFCKRYFNIFQSDQKIEEKFAQICACVCDRERERERERKIICKTEREVHGACVKKSIREVCM